MGDEERYEGESYETASSPAKGSTLPWVLLGLTVLLAAAIVVLLVVKQDAERGKSAGTEKAMEELHSRVTMLETSKKQLEAQVESLQSDKTTLANERDALSARLQQSSSVSSRPAPPEKKTGSSSSKKGGKKKRHR